MKKFPFLLLASCIGFCPGGFRTANAKAADEAAGAQSKGAPAPPDPAAELEQLKAQFKTFQADAEQKDQQLDALQKQNVSLSKKVIALQTPPPPAKPKLDLGPFALPAGVDEEDVMWRMKGGLNAKMAIQAAIQQGNHEKAKKAAAKKQAQSRR